MDAYQFITLILSVTLIFLQISVEVYDFNVDSLSIPCPIVHRIIDLVTILAMIGIQDVHPILRTTAAHHGITTILDLHTLVIIARAIHVATIPVVLVRVAEAPIKRTNHLLS